MLTLNFSSSEPLLPYHDALALVDGGVVGATTSRRYSELGERRRFQHGAELALEVFPQSQTYMPLEKPGMWDPNICRRSRILHICRPVLKNCLVGGPEQAAKTESIRTRRKRSATHIPPSLSDLGRCYSFSSLSDLLQYDLGLSRNI
jgi:hypothetical protein